MYAEAAIVSTIGILSGLLLKPMKHNHQKEHQEAEPNETYKLSTDRKHLVPRSTTPLNNPSTNDEKIKIIHICRQYPAYTIFCIVVICFEVNFHIGYNYIPDRAVKQLGIQQNDVAFIVSVMGENTVIELHTVNFT